MGYWFKSWGLKVREQELPCPRTGKDGHSSSRREREFALPSPFRSIQAPDGLGNAAHVGESGSLLHLPDQMLIISRRTLTDTPRDNVFPTLWASLRAVKLTLKMNHYNAIRVYLSFSLLIISMSCIYVYKCWIFTVIWKTRGCEA